MDTFVYESIDLERPAFRLLQLLRGGKGLAIECILYQAYLDGDDTIPYDALSYTWGDMDKTSTVKVNGKSLEVTENLHSALQHLRSENMDRILWVDAICIDQSNEIERGHQVQQMCKTYSQAEEVVVWLGQATEATDVFMESLQRLDEYSSMHKHRHWDLAQWTTFWDLVPKNPCFEPHEAMNALLWRPWFERVWILQEIANAKKASILCGTKSVRAQTFALAPSLVGITPDRHCQAVLDIMPGRLRENTWWTENRDLYNLLLKFSESEASDPRDKVYALLGISSDAQDTDNLRPNYTKGLQSVIHDTSSFLFGPSDTPCETMSELLKDLASRSVASFVELARMSDVSEVDRFLKRRGLEVPLSEDMIKAAAANEKHGQEIISSLFRQRRQEVLVTEEVIKTAAGNEKNGLEIMKILYQERRNELKITEGVLKAAAGNEENGLEIMKYLHWGGPVNDFVITEGVIRAAVKNNTSGSDIMNLLLREVEGQLRTTIYANLTRVSRDEERRIRELVHGNDNSSNMHRILYEIIEKASLERIYLAAEMLLQDPGANIDVEGGTHDTAPKAVPANCREAVVKLLLEPIVSSIAHRSPSPFSIIQLQRRLRLRSFEDGEHLRSTWTDQA